MSNLFTKAKVAVQALRSQKAENRLNLKPKPYVNPGGWTDGRTDFVIVSENQIALCSWRTPPDIEGVERTVWDKLTGIKERRDWVKGWMGCVKKDDSRIKDGNPIKKFLELTAEEVGRRSLSGAESIHVFASYRAPYSWISSSKFTPDRHAIVFLGDTHLHLFRESMVDGFTTGRKRKVRGAQIDGKPVYRKVSQVHELAAILKHCRNVRAQLGGNLSVFQIGDLVDLWHAQLICLEAHRYMMRVIKKAKKKEEEGAFRITYGVLLSSTPEKDQDLREIKKVELVAGDSTTGRIVHTREWPRHVDAFDALAIYLYSKGYHKKYPVSIKLRGITIDYTSWKSIYGAILGRYMGELEEYADELVAVPGNHDMFVDHPYLKFLYKHQGKVNFHLNTAWVKQQTFEERHEAAQTLNKFGIRLFPPGERTGKQDFTKPHLKWIDFEDDKYDDPPGPTAQPIDASAPKECREAHGFLTGKDNCIWFEHGHAFDPYNNKHVFFREDKRWVDATALGDSLIPTVPGGFKNTGMGVESGFGGKTPTKRWMTAFSNANLNDYVLRRCKAIYDLKRDASKDQGRIRLVVLGHTHFPWLLANAFAIQVGPNLLLPSSFRGG